jgi:putative oxygen-independent coproporphyrinogen III oxidase
VTAPPPFGIYVHVPFCAHRCDYCAFATYTDRDHVMGQYVDACLKELDRAYEADDLPLATSAFFGGGTPSRLEPDDLCRLVEALPLAKGAEVTVECNPEDATVARLERYRQAGVTRMSFGVQSTQDAVLVSLGRRQVPHALMTVAEAVSEAGFEAWNVDLIFGAAAESERQWAETLDDVLGLAAPPPHISAYALTVEPGTPLAKASARHPDDDAQATRYEITERRLSEAGYRWEEISNWARPGYECRHNHLYWDQGDYLGLGSAAHSHRSGHRWWNVRTPERYIDAVAQGHSPRAGEEVLDAAQSEFEALTLSLRTAHGVPESALPDLPELEGLVTRIDGRAVLTVQGRLLANELSTRIIVGASGRNDMAQPIACAR